MIRRPPRSTPLSLHDALPILRSRHAPSQFLHRGARGKRLLSSLFPQQRKLRRRSEEHTSELQSRSDLVCRLLLEKKKTRPHALWSAPALTENVTTSESPPAVR